MKKLYLLFVGIMLCLNTQSQISQINDPLMYGGNDINAYAKNSSCVLVATDGGIFKTTDQGQSWTNATHNFNPVETQCNRIVSIGNNFYALGSSNSGNSPLYKSSDNGTTWSQLSFSNYSWQPQTLGKLSNTLYVVGFDWSSMNSEGSLYSSTDGVNWSQKAVVYSGNWNGGDCDLLSFNQDKLYLFLQDNLYYTTDGNTMNTVSVNGLGISGFSNDDKRDFQGDASGNLYYGNSDGGGSDIYKYNFTTDTWSDISAGKIPDGYQMMGFSVTDDALFLTAMSSSLGMKFYKSTDQGTTFVEQATGLSLPMISDIIQVSTNGFIGLNLYGQLLVSANGGSSWTSYTNQFIASYAGNLIHSGTTLLFSTNTRGIVLSTNQGLNWNTANNGIPGFGGIAYFVNQIIQAKDTLFSFLRPDPYSDNVTLYKSTNNGTSWAASPITAPYNTKGSNYTFAGKCDSALFVNYYDSITSKYALIVTYNNGRSWVKPGSQNNDHLTFIKGTKKCLFAFNAYEGEWNDFDNVYKANSFGMSFSNINPSNLFNGSFMIKRTADYQGDKSGAIMDLDASNSYAIFAINDRTMGNPVDRLYLYNNTTDAWTEINATGLPADYIANCIKNTGNDHWFLATNLGLYQSTNGGVNWTITHNASDWQNGIVVNSIQLINNKVFLGTQNNGIWEENLATGLIAPVSTKDILVYPNPATDAFHVTGFEGMSTITVSDLNGRLLLSKNISDDETVSVSILPNGVYLATIKSNNTKKTEKLIIQR